MKILVDMRVYEPALQRLQAIPGLQVRVLDTPEERTRELPHALIEDCDALFCTFPPENLRAMHALRFVQISSAGYAQLVGKGLDARGVRAANALGVFDIPIAEWNIAMMVNLARDLRGMMRDQSTQVWSRSARYQQEIRGNTVGIWGYGGIGRETARLSKAMGLRVHVLARSGVGPRENVYCVPGTGDEDGTLPDRVYSDSEREAFLSELDFLILAMPQTISTTGIVGEREFAMMKPTAFLLNPARGPLVDEQALISVLQTRRIGGAALDTHHHYPMPEEHPLWTMPNVVMTPHISGSSLSPRFMERVWDIFVQNMQRLVDGEPLLNELAAKNLTGS